MLYVVLCCIIFWFGVALCVVVTVGGCWFGLLVCGKVKKRIVERLWKDCGKLDLVNRCQVKTLDTQKMENKI